jgi:hypothetical protein
MVAISGRLDCLSGLFHFTVAPKLGVVGNDGYPE